MDPNSRNTLLTAGARRLPATVENTYTYSSPGTYTLSVAAGKAIRVDVRGAQGGYNGNINGSAGLGGRTQGTYILASASTLLIRVGGAGSGATGGIPGGGSGQSGTYGPSTGGGGYSGVFRDNSEVRANALFMAGGGGGHGWFNGGGSGGGETGGNGSNTYGGPPTTGGTQIGPGSNPSGSSGSGFNGGSGAATGTLPGGGGGGGWYGGGGGCGGTANNTPGVAGGGGGSGYAHPDAYGLAATQGFQSGNGYIQIEVLI